MSNIDIEDMEDEAMRSLAHLVSGAIAGTAEHCGMYPVDTVKTHLQAATMGQRLSIRSVIHTIYKDVGFLGFFRGLTAIASGAGPAHAIYFYTYEVAKRKLPQFGLSENTSYSLAGILATMISDGIMSPVDVIKQRMQLNKVAYKGNIDCMKKIFRGEGIKAFYAGYTTTITMTIPYNAIYFPVYEIIREVMKKRQIDYYDYNIFTHIFAGAVAGVVAAAFTNPLDVAKTKLQTQGDLGNNYRGMLDALINIKHELGYAGYLRGIVPRMVFHSFSAGICWATYEYFKFILKAD